MQVVTTIGLDIAKSVFQVHGVDAAGQVLSAIASAGTGWLMASVIYRCPTKAVKVQVWFDEPTNDHETYMSIRCPACARIHLVNPVTGKTPADG
jgi:hypothetical protein